MSETKYILFHSPRKKIVSHNNPIVGTTAIEKVKNFKYLGLILDATLSWKEHIEHLRNKIASLCGLMHRVKTFVPKHTLLSFYYSCIHSHLLYLIIVWGHASKSNLQKIQVLQNRCLKIIFHLPQLFSTVQLYSNVSHNILPLRGLCKLQTCLFMYDILKKTNMHQNLSFTVSNHEHNTRYANNLLRSRASTCLGQMRISFYGPSEYNALPESLKTLNNRSLFKSSLKRHYKSSISDFL